MRMSKNNVIIVPDRNGWASTDPQVPSKVVSLNSYDNFIIAKREVLDYDTTATNQIHFDYWIIETRSGQVWQNNSEQRFTQVFDSLDISEAPIFIDVYDY